MNKIKNTRSSLLMVLFFRFLRALRYKLLRIKMQRTQEVLAKKKNNQRLTYFKLAEKFQQNYEAIKSHNLKKTDKFVTPLWKKYNSRLEKRFLPYPPFSFIEDPDILLTLFTTSGGDWLNSELVYLEKKLPRKILKNLLEEDYVGDPLLWDTKYLTSHTAVHHLYHFIKFLDTTKTKNNEIKTIVEWGGGYGSMVRILKKYLSKKTTYIMIDTPLFSCLQWLYLATIFGEKDVNLLLNKTDKIKEGKINLVSLGLLESLNIKADLFISTWALSESDKYSQDFVLKKNWFNAKHLLIAFNDNSAGLFNSGRVGELAASKGAVIEDIEFLTSDHYAFL